MSARGNACLYRFGIYEADVRSGELRKNGSKLKLQDQPFEVLVALLERPGEVVTREELRERLWPADTFVDFDHSLNTAINKLREALGDSAANPRFIETLAKRGYRFIAPIQSEAPAPPGVAADVNPPHDAINSVATHGQPSGGMNSAATRSLDGELPRIDRRIGRTLFALIQVMYLCFYVATMWKLATVAHIVEYVLPRWDWLLLIVAVMSAVLGIPTRLYLLTAAVFDFRQLGEKFRRLFPFLLPLDQLWALSPFLLADKMGFGLAFAATAALLYLPFSQRTLIRMTYPAVGQASPVAG